MDNLATFYLVCLSHLIADQLLQGNLAFKKSRLNKYMLLHVLIVSLLFIIPVLNYPFGKVSLGLLVTFFSHLIIDILKVEAGRWLKLTPEKYLFWAFYGTDQILHLTVIYLIVSKIL